MSMLSRQERKEQGENDDRGYRQEGLQTDHK